MTPKKLRLALLGQSVVTLDGNPVTGFNSDKTRALLFYLATVPEAHSRPALAGLFWGDLPEERAAGNLRKSLTSLRKVVGSHLTITRRQIAFRLDAPHEVDVNHFRTAVTEATSQRDIPKLARSVEEYHGEYLAEFFVRDAAAFEEWMMAERRHLQELALGALHTLTTHFADQGELTKSITYAKKLLAIEPWREEVHRLLMTLYVRSGQPGAAIGQFRHCQETMRQELDVDVMPETVALYDEIREQALRQPHVQLAAVHAEAAPPSPPPGITKTRLPAPATTFVGREAERAQICERLTDKHCRLLTLLGTGGVGKTTLSIIIAHELSGDYDQQIYFIDLSGIDDPEYLAPTILDQMALSFSADQTPLTQLQQYMAHRRSLLILDNFEHLLAAAPQLSTLLTTAPGLDLLVTSRQRLNLREEWVLEIDGLSYPEQNGWHLPKSDDMPRSLHLIQAKDASALQAAEASVAIQLFLARAQQVRAGFIPTSEELTAIGRICRHVEGLPLAIELAASWIKLLSPSEILAELENGLELLATTAAVMPERHQSLHTVFERSWHQLRDDERILLQQLTVFRGGFTIDAARAITSGSVMALARLADHSFVLRVTDNRFRIPEVLRRFAAEAPAHNHAMTQSTQQMHYEYFLGLLCAFQPQLDGLDPRPASKAIEADLDNIRAAWFCALERSALPAIRQAAEGLLRFLEDRDRFFEAIHLIEASLKRLRITGDPYADVRSNCSAVNTTGWTELTDYLTVQLGYFCMLTEQFDRSTTLLTPQLTALTKTAVEPAFEAFLRYAYARLQFRLGNLDLAEREGEKSLALNEELQQERAIANTLNHLGIVAAFRGDYPLAAMRMEEAAVRARSAGALSRLAAIYANLANVHGIVGNESRAERLYHQSEQLLNQIDKPIQLALLYGDIGQHELDRGRYRRALTQLQQGYAIYQQQGVISNLVNNLNSQTQAYIALGDLVEARESLCEGIRLATSRTSSPWLHVEQALLLAKLLVDSENDELITALLVATDQNRPEYAYLEAWATDMRSSILAELNEPWPPQTSSDDQDRPLVDLLVDGMMALQAFYTHEQRRKHHLTPLQKETSWRSSV